MAAAVRPLVWARDRGTCRYPHDHPLMGKTPCSAPWPDRLTLHGWERDPRNRGYLALCHVIPVELGGPLAWNRHNLFVGCDAGNGWQEDHTGDAITVGVHGRMGDQVHEGRTLT